jgi:hypothetical protein
LSINYTDHPLPVRLFNSLAPAPTLKVDKLLRKARRKTGLDDYGDDWFIEPLSVLVKSINTEANLSALGRAIMHKRLVDALVTRLRAEQLFKQHPEILDIDLGHVFVIAGLQRTGTTLLHRLMASNPDIRAPLSWEALSPIPLPEKTDPEGRIEQAKRAERGLKFISPTFFAIHPVEWDMPEEDVLFLDISFMSQSAEATMRVPTYAKWLEGQDSTPSYEYLKKLMQVLHWNQPAKHTLLKSPHHMEYIDTILKVFPGASIIQTHRDPQKTMASFTSMVCHGAGVFSDDVDVLEYSIHWQRKVHRLIERSIAVRVQSPEHFLDINYADLVHDPIGQLQRIYDHGRVNFNERTVTLANALLTRQVQHKYGRHYYNLSDFGMNAAQLESDFALYRETFHIPFEGGHGL